MKTLILMRHAKSSWAELGQDDHDRPLNKRGREAAPLMAEWLAARGTLPDRILCSTAARARETFERMRAAVPALPAPVLVEALYHAMPAGMHGALRALPRDCATALLIAHEPGISAYAEWLGGPDAPRVCQRAYGHFPTAAMAVMEAEIGDWRDLEPAVARFTEFAVPKEVAQRPGSRA